MKNNSDKKMLSGLEMVVMRNEFYRDNYYRVLLAVLMVILINAGLAGLLFYKINNPPQPQYFAATADGRIIKIQALSDPALPDDVVLQWTADAIRKSFNLDYLHWREQLRDASVNFTADGWNYFSAALKATNDLKTLVDLKMVSDAQITGAPQIVKKALIDGHYAWNIKIPLLVTFINKDNTINQPMNLTVIVLREPAEYYPQKIAINNVFSETVNPAAYGDA